MKNVSFLLALILLSININAQITKECDNSSCSVNFERIGESGAMVKSTTYYQDYGYGQNPLKKYFFAYQNLNGEVDGELMEGDTRGFIYGKAYDINYSDIQNLKFVILSVSYSQYSSGFQFDLVTIKNKYFNSNGKTYYWGYCVAEDKTTGNVIVTKPFKYRMDKNVNEAPVSGNEGPIMREFKAYLKDITKSTPKIKFSNLTFWFDNYCRNYKLINEDGVHLGMDYPNITNCPTGHTKTERESIDNRNRFIDFKQGINKLNNVSEINWVYETK